MKTGRPTLLTRALQKQLCDLLAGGIPLGTSCEACGIAPRTARDWLHRGATEKGFSAFAAAISRARARGRVFLVKRITAAGDWRADAWLLARLAPDEFGVAAAEESANDNTHLHVSFARATKDSPPVEFKVIDVAAEE